MALTIKNNVLIFLSIFLPLFFGLVLRGSLGVKLLITAGLLVMSLIIGCLRPQISEENADRKVWGLRKHSFGQYRYP